MPKHLFRRPPVRDSSLQLGTLLHVLLGELANPRTPSRFGEVELARQTLEAHVVVPFQNETFQNRECILTINRCHFEQCKTFVKVLMKIRPAAQRPKLPSFGVPLFLLSLNSSS